MKKPLAYLLIGIIGLLIANQGFYTHAHRLNDGFVITHSHPFDKKQDSQPIKTHHHTQAEFIFLANSNLLFFSGFLIVSTLSIAAKKLSFVDVVRVYSLQLSFPFQGRAPPVL